MLNICKNQLIACLLLLYSGLVSAANVMQISSATVQANQQVVISIGINNSDPFVAFQIDIVLPAPFTYVSNSAALSSARSNGHSINATLLNGNTLRILGFSFNNSPFTGNSGAIATFSLNSGTVPGDYTLTPANAIIGQANSGNILSGITSGTLTLQAPDINLSAASLDFGNIPLGGSSDQFVTISNPGNQNLIVSNITFNSPYFTVVGNTSFTILPGASSVVTVRFTSTVKGNFQKTMIIATNDPDQAISRVSLQAIAFAVNELHCGNMFSYSGSQANLSLSINNMEAFTGFQFDLQLPSPLTFIPGSAQLSGRKTNHFVSANVLSGNVLRVIAYSANNQTFSGNTGTVVTMSFAVKGTGGWYSLNLSNVFIGDANGQNIVSASYNGSEEIAAANISCNTDLAFGDVSTLETATQTFRVYNFGNDTLKINQLQFVNQAYSTNMVLPLRINQGNYTDIPVNFHPTSEGQNTSTLKIFSNDPDENPKNITLSGKGYIANYLSVMDTSYFKPGNVTIQISAENYEPFVGFQFDISFPASMSYIPGSAMLTNRAQGHSLTTTLIDATTVRVLAFSMQQLPFLGSSGAVVSLSFSVNVTGPHNTLALSLSNAIMGNSQSQNILYGTHSGDLQIFNINASGSLNYNNTQKTPIDLAKVYLTKDGVAIDSTVTSNSGNYFFEHCANGNYTIKVVTHKSFTDANATDALAVQRHVAGLELLTEPVRILAADVNLSNSVNGTDALKIKRRFASLDNSFQRGDWVFAKPIDGGNDITVNGASVIQNFYGLCVGDVNGSNVPGTGAKSALTYAIEYQGEIEIVPNTMIQVPVRINRSTDISAITMLIQLSPGLFKVEDVKIAKGNVIFNTIGDELRIVWSEIDGLKLSAGDTLFTLDLTVNDIPDNSFLYPFSLMKGCELADKNADPVEEMTFLIPQLIQTLSVKQDINSGFTIYPNPTSDKVTINFRLTAASHIKCYITDLTGKKLVTVYNQEFDQGQHSNTIDLSKLIPGIYIMCLNSENALGKTETCKHLIILK